MKTDNLVKRGWTRDTDCVLCGVHIETMNHLFTQCVFIKFIMVIGEDGVQESQLGEDVLN